MAQHTPGPWHLSLAPVSGKLCVMSDAAWICGQLSNGNGEEPGEGLANARLIAAAPEMLDALKGLLERCHVMGCGDGPEALEAARVIANAEGR